MNPLLKYVEILYIVAHSFQPNLTPNLPRSSAGLTPPDSCNALPFSLIFNHFHLNDLKARVSQLYECQQVRWASQDKSVQVSQADKPVKPVLQDLTSQCESAALFLLAAGTFRTESSVTLSLLKSKWEVFHEILQSQLYGRHSKGTLRILTFHF